MGDRKQLAPYVYLGGLLALLFGAGWFIVNRQFDLVVQAAIGLCVAAWAGAVLLDPDRVRGILSGRQARYGSNALLLSLAFAGILIVINYFAAQNPQSIDLTEDQQYSLAPQTVQVLASLQQPITIKGFYTGDASQQRGGVEPLLERYQAESNGLVTYEFVDPRANPLEAEQYGVSRDATLVVVRGQDSEVVSFANERELTSAILRVSQPGRRVIYFLTGHGERDIQNSGEGGYAEARRALTAKGYTPETLNLLADAQVPNDAQAVVIAGPQAALQSSEVEALASYLDAGGSLIVLYDPGPESRIDPETDPLSSYLEQDWGIILQDNLVVDLTANFRLNGIAAEYGDHPITNRLGNLVSIFPTVRTLTADPSSQDVTPTDLVMTGQDSWGETDIDAVVENSDANFDEEEDQPGPLTIAVAAERTQPASRIVVFGDTDFAINGNYNQYGNGDLFANSIDWGAREEQLINLTPRDRTQRVVAPPSVQMVGLIFLLTVIFIPGAVVGTGVAVWWRRRRNR